MQSKSCKYAKQNSFELGNKANINAQCKLIIIIISL